MTDKIFQGLFRSSNLRFRQRVAGKIVHLMRVLSNCGKSHTYKRYAQWALGHNYTVELHGPEPEWWNGIRVLLKCKKYAMPACEKWKG